MTISTNQNTLLQLPFYFLPATSQTSCAQVKTLRLFIDVMELQSSYTKTVVAEIATRTLKIDRHLFETFSSLRHGGDIVGGSVSILSVFFRHQIYFSLTTLFVKVLQALALPTELRRNVRFPAYIITSNLYVDLRVQKRLID